MKDIFHSIRVRFFVSVGFNILRAGASFVTVLLLARKLAPADYGHLMFLLGSFVAIKPLLDLGASNAFFTFISQQTHNRRIYILYFCWLLLQFLLGSIFILFICPLTVLENTWLGHPRNLVAWAFVASFFQNQIWATVIQVGEAQRKTIVVQLLGFLIAIANLLGFITLDQAGEAEIRTVFYLYTAVIVLFTGASVAFLRVPEQSDIDKTLWDYRQILSRFYDYCRPLIYVTIGIFLYDFLDKWMLQKYAGASEQGYFQIANQFSAISLLVTSSILNVFWKEIAIAEKNCDHEKVKNLYHRVSRTLVFINAALSGFLVPWSKQIVLTFLGEPFLAAYPILTIMFLYPVHQAIGQVTGAMFLACSQTKQYMQLAFFNMALSIPVSYLMQAPPDADFFPGLGLGAMGMAIKMVLLQMIGVNLAAWLIAKMKNWTFEWVYQVTAIGVSGCLGYGAYGLALFIAKDRLQVWPLKTQFAFLLSIGAVLFFTMILVAVIIYPPLAGMTREELFKIVASIKAYMPKMSMRIGRKK